MVTFSPGFNALIAVSSAVNKLPTVELVSSAPFALSNTLSAFPNAVSNACCFVESADVYFSAGVPSFGLILRASVAKSCNCFILLFNCVACET